MWTSLLGGIALALVSVMTGHPYQASLARPSGQVPVFAVMTLVAGHSFGTFAVGFDTYAVVIDRHAYARTFDGSLGELELAVKRPDDQAADGRTFDFRFGPGPIHYSTSIPEPHGATGFAAGAGSRSQAGLAPDRPQVDDPS